MSRLPLVLAFVAGCTEYALELPSRETPSHSAPVDDGRAWHEETILQPYAARADVLWVVDNSGSMAEEQEAIAAGFTHFARWLSASDLDWHLGVISTDMDDPTQSGRLRRVDGHAWIDPATPNPEHTFATLATLGTDGSWQEEGRAAVTAALGPLAMTDNVGFLRPDAGLSIIVVSDEDDDSDASPSLADFLGWLGAMRGERPWLEFHGIVGEESTPECPVEVGDDYLAVTAAIGGTVHSICSSDWPAILDALGARSTGLRHDMLLAWRPDPSSIDVWAELIEDGERWVWGFEAEEDWVYDPIRNAVVFVGRVPPRGTTIHVAYAELDGTFTDDTGLATR